MRVWGRSVAFSWSRVREFCPLALCLLLLPLQAAALFEESGISDTELKHQRLNYRSAMDAAKAGQWRVFEDSRVHLESYPLAPYLDYTERMRRLDSTSGEQARRFVDANNAGPLGVRYLGHYLDEAGRDKRWGDFLGAVTREPRSERLRCYYGRALRGRGRESDAWDLASRLWLSGSSIDDACDPLFRLWREEGELSDALVWQRAVLAYGARQRGLLRYVSSLGGKSLREPLDGLLQSYAQPHRSVPLAATLAPEFRADVLVLGLERLSRYDPAKALNDYESLASGDLSQSQAARVERAIAFRGILEQEPATRDWIDRHLARWADDKLTEMRLRWAVSESDWNTLRNTLPALSSAGRGKGVWLYWEGRALAALGDDRGAREKFARVARERSYYGFLSADQLGAPYSFGNAAAAPSPGPVALTPVTNSALQRVRELNLVQEPLLAHGEWTHALQRLDAPRQVHLARIAKDQGWYRFAIDAANAGGASDALELRFPLAYVDDFRERASAQALPVSELMAIARRESAFFPNARSPVGARGLMQLMPATGRAVARSSGIRLDLQELYGVNRNLDLGSAYYRQLLDRFDGNRAVALAAYNAGPNRVQHWIGDELPLDAWIETIPYRETRDYVKAVLAYTVVFDHRMGEAAQLLTARESQARY